MLFGYPQMIIMYQLEHRPSQILLMDKSVSWLTFISLLFVLGSSSDPESSGPVMEREAMFSDCGGILRETRGIISTPSFPNPYPVPINCRWVIEAPSDKVIAIYFTQFYMREGLSATEYAFFSDTLYMGKKDFGMISSDREPTYLVSNKPVLVLDFTVREVGNIHMRVREFLLDVFGFNITYEMIGRNETVRKDACLYHHCSFTGYCYGAAYFDRYYCHCFSDYFGAECQYDPGCGPSGSNNMCQNGGTCRYYIGSTVRTCECPPGYDGAKCDKRKDDRGLMECAALGCSQTCALTASGDYRCTCRSGFHLLEDRKTCIEKGRTRYLVSFKLYDQNVDLAHLDATRYNQLKKGIETSLLQLFQPRLYKAENLTVLSFQPGAVVQFHFFGEKEDSHQAKTIMEESLKRGRIGKYAVDRNYIRFEWEPALSIQSIETSEKMPVVEGTELSLACITQGSSAMQVQWFKDGASINIQTSYRGMWTTLVPKNSKDQYTALLGFDKTYVLDSGVFTCQVSDWGTVQNKSIQVAVVTVPKPLVSPLTATVSQGEQLVITCLSQEDIYGNFGYNWLKNGRILNPSTEPEMVEDLFPAGSRVIIPSAKASATYTCIITSTAGATRKDSMVTVLTKGTIPTCPAEEYMEVKWALAAANTEDIQLCPEGYTGDVRRHCNLRKGSGADWGEPDYSKCLSSEFLVIKEKFQSLRMGYLMTEVGTLMHDLKLYLWNMRDRFHIAEGEPVVDLLEGLHDYQRKHGKYDDVQFKNNSQVFLDIVSFLLDSPQLIQKQSHIIKLHQQILSHGLLHGTSVVGETFHMFERSALVLEVGQVQNEGQHILRFPSSLPARDVKDLRNDLLPVWLTDSVELDFNTWIVENFQEMNDSISIAVVFYKNFSAFLPERFLARQGSASVLRSGLDMEYQLHSRLVAVAMQTGQRRLGTRSTSLKVKARLAHLNHTVNRQIMWNISCGMADFSQGNVQFSMEGCQPVQTGNYSLCQCNHVGTYAVLLTTYAQPEELHFNDAFEIIAGIGCAICAFFVCLTFFILLVLWRKIRGAITALKIQVCVALLGAYGTILKALHESLRKEFYPYIVSLIQFFLLAAFCMQLCLGLTVYIEFVDLKSIRYPELKLATMGWAVPMIVVGATLAAQVPEGFNLNSWWLKIHTNYFYAYATSIVIISVLQVLLVLTVKAELRCHQKMDSTKHEKTVNRSRLLHRSLVVATSLLLVSVSSILYINFDEELFKYAFAASSGVLGFVVFLCYTVCSENAHSLCSSSHPIEDDSEKQEPRLKTRSSSFQSFLKPEIVNENYCANKIQETVDVDMRMEKIRKLRFQVERVSQEREWKEIDHLLKEKEKVSIVRDVTVHHVSRSRPKDIGLSNSDSEDGFRDLDNDRSPQSFRKQWRKRREEPLSPPFELQQLEGSPRSSHLHIREVHVIGPDGEEDTQFFEYSPHRTGPDVIAPSQNLLTNNPSCQLLIPASTCLAFPDVSECGSSQSNGAEDQSALVGEGVRTNYYATYRPSSLIQFEGAATISEEDETDAVGAADEKKLDNHETTTNGHESSSSQAIPPPLPSCPPLLSLHNEREKLFPSCDDNGNPTMAAAAAVAETMLKRDGIRRDLPTASIGLHLIATEKEAPGPGGQEQNTQSKKGWSITTV